MALIKKIETESGAIVEYHNVALVKEPDDGTLKAYINSYISKEARQAGRPPVKSSRGREEYDIPQEHWKGNPDGIEASAYSYLKTLPKFNGAEDELMLSGKLDTREYTESDGEEDDTTTDN